jgi:hypothetical protein
MIWRTLILQCVCYNTYKSNARSKLYTYMSCTCENLLWRQRLQCIALQQTPSNETFEEILSSKACVNWQATCWLCRQHSAWPEHVNSVLQFFICCFSIILMVQFTLMPQQTCDATAGSVQIANDQQCIFGADLLQSWARVRLPLVNFTRLKPLGLKLTWHIISQLKM